MNKTKKKVGWNKSQTQIVRHQDSIRSVGFSNTITPVHISKKDLLPSQDFMDSVTMSISNCTILYKLKHIETQASKSRRRKIGKSMGFAFPSLRTVYSLGKDEADRNSELFTKCLFNPSDRTILHEHIKNLETPKLRFINCKFLRRKKALMREKLLHFWRWQSGNLVKFTCESEKSIEISNQAIWLKDLPPSFEYVIENLKHQ